MERTVTLVDTEGNAIGTAGLLEAHTGEGKLHRAFSVYVFSPEHSSLLIQKRSKKKMLWPDIWANTCCSHPFEGEGPVAAGQRRLQEELGIECPLRELRGAAFVYRAEDPGRGVEHEYDILLTGTLPVSTPVQHNPDEVDAWEWIRIEDLMDEMEAHPDEYAPWLHIGLPKVLDHL